MEVAKNVVCDFIFSTRRIYRKIFNVNKLNDTNKHKTLDHAISSRCPPG